MWSLSNERLEITKSGLVRLKLKTAYSDGTSHLIFTPGELIEKRFIEKWFIEKQFLKKLLIENLSAIIPPPKSHLVKWSGGFAPNSPCRKKVVLKPDEKKAKSPKSSCIKEVPLKNSPLKNSSWNKMLAKVFKIDVTQCQYCKGEMAFLAAITVAAITNLSEVARYLGHIGIEHDAPARASAGQKPLKSGDFSGYNKNRNLYFRISGKI